MAYIKRDPDGRIQSIVEHPSPQAEEEVALDDPEVRAFLGAGSESGVEDSLHATDESMARVTEDLIQLMIRKHMILLTELPRPAQQVLLDRQSLRSRISGLSGLVGEDDVL